MVSPSVIDSSRGEPALTFLRARLASMSGAERKIADALLRAPDEAVQMSITELADRAGVSEATVSRFCRRLKFKGYQDLRIHIARELAPQSVTSNGPVTEDPLSAAATATAELLDQTAHLLDPAALERAVSLITGARRLVCVGLGASGLAARAAAHHFLGIGMMAETHADMHVMTTSIALLTPSDVVLAFSRSGSAKDVADCIRLARAARVPTVAVTNAPRSPVAKHSDVVLHVASEDYAVVGTLDSTIVQLFVLGLLVHGCTHALGARAAQASSRVTDVIMGKLY